MLAAIASLRLGLEIQTALDRRITLNILGASVLEVARELSNLSQLRIQSSPSLNRETLVIRIKNRTVREVLNLIQETLEADRKEENGEILLFRPEAKLKEQLTREQDFRMKALQKWQNAQLPKEWTREKAAQLIAQAEAIAVQTNPRNPLASDRERMAALGREAPDHRALLAVRRLLDLNLLAQAGLGRRVVLSTRPTTRQKPIKGAEPIIERFTKEHTDFAAFAQTSLERIPEVEGIRDIRRDSKRGFKPPDRMIFAIYRVGEAPNLSIRSYLVAGSMIQTLTQDTVPLYPENRAPLPKITFAAPEAAAFARAYLEERYADMKPQGDPVSWTLGRALSAYSEALGKDVIASLPDSAASRNMYRPIGPDAYPYLNSSLDTECTWEEKDGAILIRPNNPELARLGYMDRNRYSQLISKLKATKKLTLEIAADYASQEPTELPAAGLLRAGISANTGLESLGFLDYWTSPALRFWGRLPSRTGSTEYRSLATNAKAALSDWFFNTTTALQGLAVDHNNPLSGWQIGRIEPSELFPSGIPDDLQITNMFQTIPIIWRKEGERPDYDRMEFAGWFADMIDDDLVRFATSTTRSLRIGLRNGLWEGQLEIDERPSAEGLTWQKGKDLDPDIITKLRLQNERDKQRYPTQNRIPPPH